MDLVVLADYLVADPRLVALGPRSIGATAEMPADLPGPSLYHELRLDLGVPLVRLTTPLAAYLGFGASATATTLMLVSGDTLQNTVTITI